MLSLNLLVLWMWVKSKWKYFAVAGITVLAFLSGKYSTPEKVKTVTQTITVKDVSTTNQKLDQESKVVYTYVDRPVDRVITKVVVREPTGKITETTTESTHQGNTTVAETKDKKKEVEIQVKKEIVYQDRVVEKVVKNSSNKLDFGARLGYSVFTQDSNNLIPSIPNRMVVGGYATYQVGTIFNIPIKTGLDLSSRGDVSFVLNGSF